jgi:hypothetical protein
VCPKSRSASDELHRAGMALRGSDREAPVPTNTVILICATTGNAPLRHRLIPFIPLHSLRTDRTEHGLWLPSHFRRAPLPASLWLAAIYVVCLYVAHPEPYSPRLSHVQTVAVLGSSLPYSSRYTFDEFGPGCVRGSTSDGVLIGFVRHVRSFMSVSSPSKSVALSVLGTAALKPARPALRSVLLSRRPL